MVHTHARTVAPSLKWLVLTCAKYSCIISTSQSDVNDGHELMLTIPLCIIRPPVDSRGAVGHRCHATMERLGAGYELRTSYVRILVQVST